MTVIGKAVRYKLIPPVKKALLYVVCLLGSLGYLPAAFGQAKNATNKDDIEYETITDDPMDLNKMWIHIYPIYGDAFMTNMNAGLGLQGQYLWKDKFDFRVMARRSYYRGSDLSYGIGEKTKNVDNKLIPLTYVEGGATYHVVDKVEEGEAKIIIYTKRYSEGKWASTVPEYVMVPSKVRKIIGVRAGGLYWQSSTNLGDVLKKQDIYLESADGQRLERTVPGTTDDQKIYSNVSSTAIYLGGSMGRIRNVAIKPKKYDFGVNDVIFTGYADIIFSPSITVEDVRQGGITYLSAPVKKSPLGFRAGFEGMYNRDFSWSYGAEVGMRPSIQGNSLYFSVKVGFSLASRLQQRRQAYQREK